MSRLLEQMTQQRVFIIIFLVQLQASYLFIYLNTFSIAVTHHLPQRAAKVQRD